MRNGTFFLKWIFLLLDYCLSGKKVNFHFVQMKICFFLDEQSSKQKKKKKQKKNEF